MTLTPHELQTLREQALAYAPTDLLCYREDRDDGLREHQARHWQKWLDWLEEEYGVRLSVTEGIRPAAHDPASLVRLAEIVGQLTDADILKLWQLTHLLGSIVLALAVLRGALPPVEALAAAFLDEDWQAERWGQDEEITLKRRQAAKSLAAILEE